MRKVLVVAVVGVLGAAGATAALAQGTWPSVTVKPTITPNKAGTPRTRRRSS